MRTDRASTGKTSELNKDINHRRARVAEYHGVSVVICTHNGASKLRPTIEHLKLQRVSSPLAWEVLVIDNCSNDGSGSLALELWGDGPTNLRVVSEPRLGEWNARLRGFSEARHEIVGFIDDDNWADRDWVQNLSKIMSENPKLGACGSIIQPAFEVAPPEWFKAFEAYFAIVNEERATDSAIAVCAAGMGVRAAAFRSLAENGYRSNVTGRVGKHLVSCCDTELCYALRLSGWNIAIDPSLKIRHFMPHARLDWRYLRMLVAGSASSAVALDGYNQTSRQPNIIRDSWIWAFASECKHLLKQPLAKVLKSRFAVMEGDRDVPLIDMQIARLRRLLALRRRYRQICAEIKHAPWRTQDRLATN